VIPAGEPATAPDRLTVLSADRPLARPPDRLPVWPSSRPPARSPDRL